MCVGVGVLVCVWVCGCVLVCVCVGVLVCAEQMEEQLKQGSYECMVCCDNIRQEVAVWNCQKCYHVFHLRCIKQWVKSSLEGQTSFKDFPLKEV